MVLNGNTEANSGTLQTETIGEESFSGIFRNSENDIFEITSSTKQLFAIPPEILKNLGRFPKM